jgi:molecular chaperone DnaJ
LECRGSGKVKQKKELKIKIPAGVDDGTKLRIEGEGEAGDQGAPRGDLYVIIHVKQHDFFKRDGNNLYCEIQIPFTQAALGTTVEIPTLDGNEKLDIPIETQPGEVFRLKGNGIKSLHSYKKGDLFVKVNVETPKKLTKEQKSLLQQFAQSRGEEFKSHTRKSKKKGKNIFH